MAFENLIIYPTRREARRAKSASETVIKACGGYALISSKLYRIYRRMKAA